MSAQWPKVAAYLVRTLPTLNGWANVEVFNQSPVTGDTPKMYATVGYVADQHAGSYTTLQAPDGFRWTEAGHIRCQLVAQTGDTDITTVSGQVFALADAFEKSFRTDRTLGGTLSPDSTVETAVDVMSISNQNGAAQALVLTLTYNTTTL